MSRNRGKGTTPERYVHELAESAGLSFVRHDATLPGKPDLAFPDACLAVFVDGDFWHGWRFPTWEHRVPPIWQEKIRKTRERDQRNYRRLRRMGWRVLRLWEHQVETNVIDCIKRIGEALNAELDTAALDARYATMKPLKRRNRLPKP